MTVGSTGRTFGNAAARRAVALWLAATAAAGQAQAQGLTTITIAPPAPVATAPRERPVTFTAAQAEAGQRVYERVCVICHGQNLNDGEFGGAPLVGSHFDEVYGGGPVSTLYYYIAGLMPPDRPGQLSQSQRTEVIAYILSRNGFPEGGPPLPEDPAAMDLLMITR